MGIVNGSGMCAADRPPETKRTRASTAHGATRRFWKERGNKLLDALLYNLTARPKEAGNIYLSFSGVSHILALKSTPPRRFEFCGAGCTGEPALIPQVIGAAQPVVDTRRSRLHVYEPALPLPCTPLVERERIEQKADKCMTVRYVAERGRLCVVVVNQPAT